MKILLHCAAWLYPASWRARYGFELEALAEDMNAGWRDIWDIVRGAVKMQILSGKTARFTAACGLAGLLAGGVIALRTRSEYHTVAVLQMAPGNADDQVDRLTHAEQQILSRGSLAGLVEKYDLYREERQQRPMDGIVSGMRNRWIQIRMMRPASSDARGKTFSVAFDYPEPNTAQAVTADLSGRLVAAMRTFGPSDIVAIRNLPPQTVSVGRAWIVGLGLAGGILCGWLLIGIRRWPLIPLTGVWLGALVLLAA